MGDKGIIFDFDGVVIDSLEVQKAAFYACYEEQFGIVEDTVFDEFLSYGGDSLENIFKKMNIPIRLLEKYRAISADRIDSIKIFPGIEKVLNAFHELNHFKVCLFTGKESKRTHEILKHFQLEKYFEEVICSDQISRPKPDAEGINLIADKLMLKIEDIVMIGDAQNDICCAQNAGVKSIAALWGNPQLEVHKLNPTFIAEKPEDLIEIIGGGAAFKKTIAVINGPNMNYLGKREQDFYGTSTLDEIEDKVKELSKNTDYQVIFYQSNSESEIVDFIQEHHIFLHALIINPAALTISGYSIVEAINLFAIPFIEVHMSNIFARGDWHSRSVFSPYAVGTITGFKELVYTLAFNALVKKDISL